ncbi:MAG: 2Fe-2S iron-sulfur cluster binding domain-containing protein, partial [Actinobacteria bacterium]|nr:2Fe-2S iron-sulfur cluster binding domain-containing protein [Actinomycetota bacterium]
MIKIDFLPDKKNIKVNEGTTILEALERAGINIDTPCGGKGICGKCKVLFVEEISAASPIEKKLLSEGEIKKGFRLACQAKLFQDSIVEIPLEIKLDFKRVFSSNSKGD